MLTGRTLLRAAAVGGGAAAAAQALPTADEAEALGTAADPVYGRWCRPAETARSGPPTCASVSARQLTYGEPTHRGTLVAKGHRIVKRTQKLGVYDKASDTWGYQESSNTVLY